MTETQRLKQPIRAWLQHFPDERLAVLLAHAQDGNLAYNSCCCLVGMYNVPLTGAFVPCRSKFPRSTLFDPRFKNHPPLHHLDVRKSIPAAWQAEEAYSIISRDDIVRRRILIPMIRSEMWQRDRVSKVTRLETCTAETCILPSTEEVNA